jgi:hypothetical protein
MTRFHDCYSQAAYVGFPQYDYVINPCLQKNTGVTLVCSGHFDNFFEMICLLSNVTIIAFE